MEQEDDDVRCPSSCAHCVRYDLAFWKTYYEAERFFEKRVRDDDGPRPELVVFDIDGTVLDDRPGRSIDDWSLPRYPHAHKLFCLLRRLGYDIAFITARCLNVAPFTVRNLMQQGFEGFTALKFWPGKDEERTHEAIMQWKDDERRVLSKTHDLIAVIGDQSADVEGEHIGLRQFRLPVHVEIHSRGDTR